MERFATLYQLIEFHKLVPVADTGIVLKETPWKQKRDASDAELNDYERVKPVLASLRTVVGEEADEGELVRIIRAADYDIVRSLRFFFAAGNEAAGTAMASY